MANGRRGHDFRLLDALGEIEGEPFKGSVWRVVRKGRSVIDGSRGAGRWNPRHLEVLYAAMEANGAVAEIHHHMSLGQSVFPSRMEHVLYEVKIQSKQTLHLANMAQLIELGVDEKRYNEMLYERTQEIADAAAFLGFDGVIAPSARWACNNIVLFLSGSDTGFSVEDLEVVAEAPINWRDWIAQHRK